MELHLLDSARLEKQDNLRASNFIFSVRFSPPTLGGYSLIHNASKSHELFKTANCLPGENRATVAPRSGPNSLSAYFALTLKCLAMRRCGDAAMRPQCHSSAHRCAHGVIDLCKSTKTTPSLSFRVALVSRELARFRYGLMAVPGYRYTYEKQTEQPVWIGM